MAIEATGDLTPDELEDRRQCERAFTNADQAEWMRGKAADALRKRRLHRPLTWAQYCQHELGESESEINRMIQEWPLGATIAQMWREPLPTPSSHKRALLPLVDIYGLENTARGYILLRTWAKENRERVTAAVLTTLVRQRQQQELSGKAPDEPLSVNEFLQGKKHNELEQARRAAPNREKSSPLPQTPPSTPPTPPAAAPQNPPKTHPNLGDIDEPPEAAPEVVDAEIIEENQMAEKVRQVTQQILEDIATKLRGANPDVLKAIITLGDELIEAARKELECQ